MHKITVLIADDHFYVRLGFREALNREPDIQIIGECDSAQGALQRALTDRPDVLLMDLTWYKDPTAGIAAIRQIKSQAPEVKILAATVFQELIEPARSAGADMAVDKDTLNDRATLSARIRNTYTAHLPTGERQIEIEPLTEREREVLRLVAQGETDDNIGHRLAISTSMAKKHVGHIMAKLGATNRSAAVAIAYETGLLPKGSIFSE